MTASAPFWNAGFHAGRRPLLAARNRLRDALRAYFTQDGFCEVDPAILQVSPGNEAHIGAFATTLVAPDSSRHPLYLHTSPEFACKKLLAAGEERIFSLCHVFRNEERGPLHHPEFTMLEWYRAGEDYARMMDDCAALLGLAADSAGALDLAWRGRRCDPFAELERLGMAEAFARHAGIDLMALLPEAGAQPDAALRARFAAEAARKSVRVTPDDTWSDIFSKVLSQLIEPHLGLGRATLLTDYPASEAALARAKPDDPRLAERFELYACGVELANGFGELTDPVEQQRRFAQEMDERERIHGGRYPIDADFIAALAQMPQASGCALGFDRLVMLATGAPRIADVIWTPLPDFFA